MNAQLRALALYQSGQHLDYVIETLLDEYPNLSEEKIVKIAEEMGEVHREKAIPLENNEA